MKLFAQCIRKHILFHVVLIFLSIAFLLFFLTLSVQFKFIRHNYDVWQAALYAAAVLPVNIYALFPWFFLMSWWVAFYRMHAQGFFLHLYASGASPRDVFRSVWFVCCCSVLVFVVLGEGLGPGLERHAKRARMQAMMDHPIDEDAAVLWLREPDGFIEAHRTSDPGRLEGIRRYRFDQGGLVSIDWIAYAQHRHGVWHCAAGQRMTMQPKPVREPMGPQIWKTRLTPELLRLSQSGYLKTPLYHMRSFMKAGALGLVGKKDLLAFWTRVFLPVKMGLLTLWLAAYMSRMYLFRISSSGVLMSGVGCVVWLILDIMWGQVSSKILFIPYVWSELFFCALLGYFIYRASRASMVEVCYIHRG